MIDFQVYNYCPIQKEALTTEDIKSKKLMLSGYNIELGKNYQFVIKFWSDEENTNHCTNGIMLITTNGKVTAANLDGNFYRCPGISTKMFSFYSRSITGNFYSNKNNQEVYFDLNIEEKNQELGIYKIVKVILVSDVTEDKKLFSGVANNGKIYHLTILEKC